jgi:hypothetical protein
MNSVINKIVDPREYDIPEEAMFQVYGVTAELNLNQPEYDKQQNWTSLPEQGRTGHRPAGNSLPKHGPTPQI